MQRNVGIRINGKMKTDKVGKFFFVGIAMLTFVGCASGIASQDANGGDEVVDGYYYSTRETSQVHPLYNQDDRIIYLHSTENGLSGNYYATTKEVYKLHWSAGERTLVRPLPLDRYGFFVAQMRNIERRGDSIFFTVKIDKDSLFNRPVDWSVRSAAEALNDPKYKRWFRSYYCIGQDLSFRDTIIFQKKNAEFYLRNGLPEEYEGATFKKVTTRELEELSKKRCLPDEWAALREMTERDKQMEKRAEALQNRTEVQ